MKCPHCQLDLTPRMIVAAKVNQSDQVFLSAECQCCKGSVDCFVTPRWENGNPLGPGGQPPRIDSKATGEATP